MPQKPVKQIKAIGTHEVDIFADFVSQLCREVDKVESLCTDIDVSALPAERKEEVRAAIERIKAIEGKL